jgi:hypothetical protein
VIQVERSPATTVAIRNTEITIWELAGPPLPGLRTSTPLPPVERRVFTTSGSAEYVVTWDVEHPTLAANFNELWIALAFVAHLVQLDAKIANDGDEGDVRSLAALVADYT